MLTFPDADLEPILAKLGWKPAAVPVVARLVRRQAEFVDVRATDLREVLRLAHLYRHDIAARHRVDVRDWRAIMALEVVRERW